MLKKGEQSIYLANLLDVGRPCRLCLVAEYDVVSGRFPFVVSGRQDSEDCLQTEAFTEVSFIVEKPAGSLIHFTWYIQCVQRTKW